MRVAVLGLVVACVLGGRGWAWADSAARTWDQRLISVRGQLGIGTPLGIGGVSGELNLARPIALELGVGHNGFGPQVAALAHGRVPIASSVGLTLGLGVSRGPYEHHT